MTSASSIDADQPHWSRASAQSDQSSLSFLWVRRCPGWSESSLGAQVILFVLSPFVMRRRERREKNSGRLKGYLRKDLTNGNVLLFFFLNKFLTWHHIYQILGIPPPPPWSLFLALPKLKSRLLQGDILTPRPLPDPSPIHSISASHVAVTHHPWESDWGFCESFIPI